MDELTRDSYNLLCVMYHIYLNRIKEGMSKSQAREFEDGFYKNDKNLSKWNEDDIKTSLHELTSKDYLKKNIWDDCTFKDQAIIKMENRFKDTGSLVVEILSKIPKYIL